MTSRDLFELEHGDTGQAILPTSKVNDERAYNTAPELVVRHALAYIAGFDPELYKRAMRRAVGDWS